nr:PREDICTED: probable membrane-associated kinase regulator 6 [Daucus carota subsp. sativus]
METYQTLSIESFSYSWLANMNTSYESPGRSFGDSLDAYDEASFIEMDPQLSSSKRLFKVSQDFDFTISEAPMGLVDADELILNGFIVPAFVNQVKTDAYDASDDPAPSCASASSSSKKLHSVSESARLHGERNWDCSTSTSPQVRVANSCDNWRRSCDSESSIYEAVLHCKRTVGMLVPNNL